MRSSTMTVITTASKAVTTAGPTAMRMAFRSLVNLAIKSPVLWLLK